MKPGDAVLVRVDAGYSHEFTTAQVDTFLADEYGDYKLKNPAKFAVFEDHLIYATACRRWRSSRRRSRCCASCRSEFAAQDRRAQLSAPSTASRPASAIRSRASSSSIRATSSRRPTRTPAWAARRARSRGASARPSTRRCSTGASRRSRCPSRSASSSTGKLPAGRTAKDVMLHILATYAKREDTLNRVMEFGGDGPVRAVARRARDAREHGDRVLGARRGDGSRRHDAALDRRAPARASTSTRCARRSWRPIRAPSTPAACTRIDLATIRPMVATPGDPDRGIASDPKNGALVAEIGEVKIDIAYGGSCTAGKRDDIDMYARVMRRSRSAPASSVADGVQILHPVRLARGRGLRARTRATSSSSSAPASR